MSDSIMITEVHVRAATRPDDVPAGWEIWNAPRPLYGDMCWNGPFVDGIYYAAVCPDDTVTWTMWREENRRLKAVRLRYVTDAEIDEWFTAFCTTNGYDRAEFERLGLDVWRDGYLPNVGIPQVAEPDWPYAPGQRSAVASHPFVTGSSIG